MAGADDLVSEMRHRVANDLALICAVIDHQRRRLGTITADEALDDVAGAVMALALLYRQLYELDRTGAVVDLSDHLRSLTSGLSAAYFDRLQIRVTCPDGVVAAPPYVVRDIGLIVTDLIYNAAKHAFRKRGGEVWVRMYDRPECIVFEVGDDGIGLDTAPRLIAGGGLRLARRLALSLGGQIDVCSDRKQGAVVSLTIPTLRSPPGEAH
ncbi:sensor histidine kinase [Bosea eneae]|uniref:histidine kinase n=1 Tax=Bosea eneae TaxID=151454 RepID=A0ABW0J0P7_9HYPH